MPVKAKDKSAGQKGVPLFEFEEGGGLVKEFDGVIDTIEFGPFKYPDKEDPEKDEEVLSLLVTFQLPADQIEEMHTMYPKQVTIEGKMLVAFSIGGQAAGKFEQSKDGSKLVPTGSQTRISGGCAAALFLTSLVNAGFAAAEIEDDIRVFTGVEGHFRRQTPEGWSEFAPNARGEKPKVILCESIGEEAPTEVKAKAKKKAKSNGPGTIDQATLVRFIEEELSEEDLTPDEVKERVVGHPWWPIKAKKKFTELLDNEEFLASGGGWSYADGVLS